jgi:hypothetical protein
MTSLPADSLSVAPLARDRDYAGLAACIAVGVLLGALGWFKLGDVDTGYHITYGNHFLNAGHIVDRDPRLYPDNAVKFVNANWGSQVVMALAYRAGGPAGLIVLRTLLLGGIFAMMALLVRRFTRGHIWIALAWLLSGLAGYERFSMRPELFSYALMMACLVMLTGGALTRRRLITLGILQLLWVNLHSYFLIGPLLTGAFVLPALWRWVRTRYSPEEAAASSLARGLLLSLLIQVSACVINPWHLHGAIFPFATLDYLRQADVLGSTPGHTGSSAWSLISEFHSPFSYHGERSSGRTIEAYYVAIAVSIAGLVVLFCVRRPGEAFCVLLLLLMSTQMRRNIAQFALVAAPLSMGAFAALMPWSRISRLLTLAGRTTVALLVIAAAGNWLMQLVDGRFYYSERRITREAGAGFSELTFPEPACKWIAGQPDLQAKLFVDYFSSSNSLLWLPERFKLFVDTNTFACDERTLDRAFGLGLGKIDHTELFDRHGINAVMLHCGPDTQELVKIMVKDDFHWAIVYFDRTCVIFARRMMEHVKLILANQVSPEQLRSQDWIARTSGSARAKALALGTIANVPVCLRWWAQAAALLEEATRLADDYDDAWMQLGACYGNLANAAARTNQFKDAGTYYARALKCFDRVLVILPNHVAAAAMRHDTIAALEYLQTIP